MSGPDLLLQRSTRVTRTTCLPPTPPLEGKKVLSAKGVSERTKNSKPLRISFVDIRKAYFNGIPERAIYMQLPPEMGLGPNVVARQVWCVYGTRDAGRIWEDTYTQVLVNIGFEIGNSNPCVFYHQGKDITIVVHGDDFTALAGDAALDWYESKLKESFEIKVRGRLGERCDGRQQIKILNWVVTASDQGLTYECDPRHGDLLMSSLNLTSATSAASPGVKPTDRDDSAQKHDDIQTLDHLDYTDENQVIASICGQENSPEDSSTISTTPSSCPSAGCESIYNQMSMINNDKWHLSGTHCVWHREHK